MSLSSLPLFEPHSDWAPRPVSEMPTWPRDGRVCVDVETRDPRLKELGPGVRRGASMVGVGFAIEGGPAHYMPFGHQGGGNLDRDHVLAYLRDQAALFRGELVGANLSYDLDFLGHRGVDFRPRRFLDVLLAEPLLDENQLKYGLDVVLARHGMAGKDETHLRAAAEALGVDPKADLHRLHSRHVGAYAERDVRGPLELLRLQEAELAAQDLLRVWDVECRLLPVLVAMRRRGVRVDHDHLLVVEERARREEAEAMAAFSHQVGRSILAEDMNKNALLGPIVEEATGQRLPRTAISQPQLKKTLQGDNFLGLQGPPHPAVTALLRARRWQKTRTTFVESVRSYAVGNRVHCTFNQMKVERDDGSGAAGTVSGRLSAVDPNLQQQPARDPEIGPLWRAVYVPDEGGEWACLDFSQQEPRWVVHFAEEARCPGATAAGDAYRANPKIDNHQLVADLIGWPGKDGRTRAKGIYLGKIYGMGGAKFCRSVGLPTAMYVGRDGIEREGAGPEGQAMLDAFDAGAPFLKAVAWAASGVADERGFVRTVLGRRCRFERNENPRIRGRYRFTHKALNRVVQGTSADQVKKAMVEAEDAGIRLQLQVHDELDLTVGSRDEASRLAEIMLAAVPCRVPHLVEPSFGKNWGECK